MASFKHLLPILLSKGSLSAHHENSSLMYEAIDLRVKKASSGNADSSKGMANKDDPLGVDLNN